MKKILILTVLIHFLLSNHVSSQCLPDGITFTTQAQIDDFPSNYPGCTEILGDVTIDGWDISNLDSLYSLTAFQGNLTIKYTSLPNLIGLGNVTNVDGFFKLDNNYYMFYLTGLAKLSEIGGDFILIGDEDQNGFFFKDFRGVDSLSTIGGDLRVEYGVLEDFYGLDNLDSIYGSFIIKNLDQFWSFEYLSNLKYIGGDIEITGIFQLFNLNGLENIDPNSIENITLSHNPQLSNCAVESICNYLSSPNGSITIHHNAPGCNNPTEIANACGISLSCLPYGNYYFLNQAEIDSFKVNYPDCTELSGSVIIEGFNRVTNLLELNEVTKIDGNLKLLYNLILDSLTGLDALTEVGGDLILENNRSLESLSGLNSISKVGGDTRLYYNTKLKSLSGLENLDSIFGRFSISTNDTLESLLALSDLIYIGGTLGISGNDLLTNLNGLGNVNSIGGLDIGSTESLVSISDLENITSINGDIYIRYNHTLVDLSGLQNLVTVTGDVAIDQNWVLPSFNGLNKLSTIGGFLRIHDMGQIQDLSGLENLSSVGAEMHISGCSGLIDLTGIESLDSVGSLAIYQNYGLKNLHGLESLSTINGYLTFKFNYLLDSLTGLEGVTSIGGELKILDHPSLKSLIGLENIDAGTIGSLTITGNDSLTHCAVTSICNYLAAPNGEIEIHDNAPDCNSQEEVEYACLVGTFSISEKDSQFSIYPNPTIRELHLSSSNLLILELRIYNQFGQIVLSEIRPSNNIDVSSLNPGIYVVVFITDKIEFKEKLIIE
ncbi:MAG: T9SS type A sorting domain-containing protein [Bacteroidales bacterium]|nr:T9SS type A sorting domain-containing protein [Bacteroidales bacterium]